MGPTKYLTLSKVFEINSSIEQLQQQLLNKNIPKFDAEFLSFKEYHINAKLSVGIAISFSGLFNFPICTSLKLMEETQNKTIVNLKTYVRPELIFISLLWIISLLFKLFSETKIPFAIPFVVFPLILIWFWFVYRTQEESLHTAIEKYLKELKE